MRKWTKEELQNEDNIDFAILELASMRNKLTNPYSPKAKKYSRTINELQEIRILLQQGKIILKSDLK